MDKKRGKGKEGIKNMEWTRITVCGQHNPRADIDRLYVPRKEGRTRVDQIEAAYITETTKLAEYEYMYRRV
jgi:hypothetical protein